MANCLLDTGSFTLYTTWGCSSRVSNGQLCIIPQPVYFYGGNICECSPCADVYHCDWCVSVVHWFCLSVQLVTSLLRIMKNTGCGIMSVSHNPNQALLRTLVTLNLGLRPSFNITQCSQLTLVWGMEHCTMYLTLHSFSLKLWSATIDLKT